MNQTPTRRRKKERKKERKKKTLHEERETEEEQEQKRSAKIQVSRVRGGGDGALFCFLSCFAGDFSKGREGIGKGRCSYTGFSFPISSSFFSGYLENVITAMGCGKGKGREGN